MVVGRSMPNNQRQEDCRQKDEAFYAIAARKSQPFGTGIKLAGINGNICIRLDGHSISDEGRVSGRRTPDPPGPSTHRANVLQSQQGTHRT